MGHPLYCNFAGDPDSTETSSLGLPSVPPCRYWSSNLNFSMNISYISPVKNENGASLKEISGVVSLAYSTNENLYRLIKSLHSNVFPLTEEATLNCLVHKHHLPSH
jgi:hypothetical protein